MMKTAIYSVAGLVVLTIAASTFMTQQLHTEISINASPKAVWQHLINFDRYPQWNPFVRKISGDLAVGSQLAVTLQTPGNSPMDFEPELLVVKDNEELRWLGKLLIPGLFDGEHYFMINENPDGSTRLVQGENFSGILAWLVWSLIEQDTAKGFDAMNTAIKTLSESGVSISGAESAPKT